MELRPPRHKPPWRHHPALHGPGWHRTPPRAREGLSAAEPPFPPPRGPQKRRPRGFPGRRSRRHRGASEEDGTGRGGLVLAELWCPGGRSSPGQRCGCRLGSCASRPSWVSFEFCGDPSRLFRFSLSFSPSVRLSAPPGAASAAASRLFGRACSPPGITGIWELWGVPRCPGSWSGHRHPSGAPGQCLPAPGGRSRPLAALPQPR